MSQTALFDTLRTLVPLNALSGDNLQKLAGRTRIEDLAAGQTLFKQGEQDKWAFYVLRGEVSLAANGKAAATSTVIGGSAAARHALAPQQPRELTATATTPVQFVRIDSQLLDVFLTWEQQVAGLEVTEYTPAGDGDNEWLIRLLQTKAFLRLPEAHIAMLLQALTPHTARAGEVIIKQAAKGDFFYIVQRGTVRVTRQANAQTAPVTLADLAAGDSFGEEALLSDQPRNATVTAVTDTQLLRLAQADFLRLLKEPLLPQVTRAEAMALIQAGAGLIDVRLESEFKNGNIKGSINLPLYLLRMKAETLPPNRKYVICCDTGRRSAAGAYLLAQRGLDVYVLSGGLRAAMARGQ